jgi:hypothetical protein
MTRDDILRVMREFLGPESEGWEVDEALLEEWMPFFQALAAAEREACAKLAESKASVGDASNYPTYIAAAIRARGNK